MPRLSDFKAHYSHKYYQTNTTTIIEKQIKYKQSRWNVTAGVGTGYGVINKQADIYLGFTVGYRVW